MYMVILQDPSQGKIKWNIKKDWTIIISSTTIKEVVYGKKENN